VIGAGTFIGPLLKIVTTVAVLAAAYFFIVKPVLETTENVSSSFNESFDLGGVSSDVRKSVKEAQELAEEQQADSQAQIDEANKLLDCIGEASGDVSEIERCNRKFDPSDP
jgi:type II secretory pathway component PulM